jgi:hypothetical protein
LAEELETDFIFIDNQRKVKGGGDFSLHKNSIDITQNVAGTNYMSFLFSPRFNSFLAVRV